MIDHAMRVGELPEIGRKVRELNNPAIRELIHGAYRIVYKIPRDPDAIFVLRFWHAARGQLEIRGV